MLETDLDLASDETDDVDEKVDDDEKEDVDADVDVDGQAAALRAADPAVRAALLPPG